MRDIASVIFSLAPHLAEGAKQSDSHLMVRCPFHSEKTPSCSVSMDTPVFYCHGCQTSGHISLFLKTLGLGAEATGSLLKALGLDGKREGPSRASKLTARLTQGTDVFRGPFVLNEDLLDEYRHAPKRLMRLGFAKATLRHFEVGYDSANMRITYPIRNIYGELVGISGGRILDYQEPKYKIYDSEMKVRQGFEIPEAYSMQEVKDAILWHAHVVRPFFYRTQRDSASAFLVITEGFKACMWTWQAGYQSTVALAGNRLSPLQGELIASAVQRVVLFLDNNRAGWDGTLKAGRLLSKLGIDVTVAQYPDDRKQPDDLSPDEVSLAIENPVRYILWRQNEYVQELIHEDEKRQWRRNATNVLSAPSREGDR